MPIFPKGNMQASSVNFSSNMTYIELSLFQGYKHFIFILFIQHWFPSYVIFSFLVLISYSLGLTLMDQPLPQVFEKYYHCEKSFLSSVYPFLIEIAIILLVIFNSIIIIFIITIMNRDLLAFIHNLFF